MAKYIVSGLVEMEIELPDGLLVNERELKQSFKELLPEVDNFQDLQVRQAR